jgi:hypothetical protein
MDHLHYSINVFSKRNLIGWTSLVKTNQEKEQSRINPKNFGYALRKENEDLKDDTWTEMTPQTFEQGPTCDESLILYR